MEQQKTYQQPSAEQIEQHRKVLNLKNVIKDFAKLQVTHRIAMHQAGGSPEDQRRHSLNRYTLRHLHLLYGAVNGRKDAEINRSALRTVYNNGDTPQWSKTTLTNLAKQYEFDTVYLDR